MIGYTKVGPFNNGANPALNAGNLDQIETQYQNAMADVQTALGVGWPATIDYPTLQAACNAAATAGTRVVAAGTITTDQTLTITSSADLSGLVYNYTGSGVAVQVGTDANYLFRVQVNLPQIINTLKTGTDWSTVTGSTGVRLVNLSSCPEITIPYVYGFDTNVLVYGAGKGNVYNNYSIGQLYNGRTSLLLNADATGWVNQNTFTGGRFNIDSSHGTAVSGVTKILLTAGLSNPINNNTFIGQSLEGSVAAYMLQAAGTANQFMNVRWEGSTPKVQWQSGAVRNVIFGGYNIGNLTEEFLTGALGNTIYGQSVSYMDGSTNGLLVVENTSSATAPALTVMPPNSRASGASPATAYAIQLAANLVKLKRTGDSNDRLQLDAQNGRLYLNNATGAPSMYLGPFGTTGIAVNSANLVFGTDNANDIGAAGANRPRYVRAGTAVVTGAAVTGSRPSASTSGAGAMFLDTTLNKPIWSDGSNWRDATGTIV